MLAGGQIASMDQMTGTPTHKSTARQRWTPSQHQLQILEKLFEQGSGTPNKQRIKEITAELSQHGAISETNVYNWFQNRKARAKRKQQMVWALDWAFWLASFWDVSPLASSVACHGYGTGFLFWHVVGEEGCEISNFRRSG